MAFDVLLFEWHQDTNAHRNLLTTKLPPIKTIRISTLSGDSVENELFFDSTHALATSTISDNAARSMGSAKYFCFTGMVETLLVELEKKESRRQKRHDILNTVEKKVQKIPGATSKKQ
jgi:hypothetical protein